MRQPIALSRLLIQQFVLLAAIPALVTGAIFFWFFNAQLQDELGNNQKALSHEVAAEIGRYVRAASEEVQRLSAAIESDGVSDDQLQGFLELSAYFKAIYLTDRDAILTHLGVRDSTKRSREAYLGFDLSNSALLRGREHQPIWSSAFLSVVTGRLSVAYRIPLAGGSLIAEMEIDRLPQLSQELSTGRLVMILDQAGNVIAHPVAEVSAQQVNLSNLPLFGPGQTNSGFFEFGGQTYFGHSLRMDNPDWYIIVGQPDEVFSGPIRTAVSIWSVLMMVIVILAITIAYRSANRLSSRFSSLADRARQVANGDYGLPELESRIIELRQFSSDLQLMADAIEQRESGQRAAEENLRLLNEELEQRVQSRTADLEGANQELGAVIERLSVTMDELVQSEKLASLGSLVAGIAHELNTPIGNALMSATAARDYVRQHVAELERPMNALEFDAFSKYIAQVSDVTEANLKRAAALITSFKRVAVDQSSSQHREFQLLGLINEILLTLHPMLAKTSFDLEVDVDPEIEMSSFPGPLGQVISNLTINAVIHAFDQTIDPRLKISAESIGNRIKLHVTDNGCGIPSQNLSRIYDPFFTTRMGQGSGLGLHLVHSIVVDVLGGSIEVESTVGRGTGFEICIPSECPKPTAPH